MLYGACGIRVAELTDVNLKDFEGKDLLKVRGKGGRERYVIVGVRARDALAKYLPIREKLLAAWKANMTPCLSASRIISGVIAWTFAVSLA
jgi:site-specific recombinase XerD